MIFRMQNYAVASSIVTFAMAFIHFDVKVLRGASSKHWDAKES
jgi:hypothetical protein